MQTDWKSTLRGYTDYLALEQGLSENSIDAYKRAVTQFADFLLGEFNLGVPNTFKEKHIEKYISHMYDLGLASSSQARIISSIRNFCKYMRMENLMDSDPLELISTPKLNRKLPDILSVENIEEIISKQKKGAK